jgi:hypothetical protein
MWILILMVMTTEGRVVFYDQGPFATKAQCVEVGVAMVDDFKNGTNNKTFQYGCLEYKL